MGRIIKTLLSLSICLSLVVSIPVFAADDQEKTYDTVNVESVSIDDFDYVSEILTYDEMIQRYADNANISFEEALKFFPKTRMASPRVYIPPKLRIRSGGTERNSALNCA